MTEKNFEKVMDQATDKATANLKGVHFKNTNEVLNEFDSKMEEAAKLASESAHQK